MAAEANSMGRPMPSNLVNFLIAYLEATPEQQAFTVHDLQDRARCNEPCRPTLPTLDGLRAELAK
jgi:hypothetical protein